MNWMYIQLFSNIFCFAGRLRGALGRVGVSAADFLDVGPSWQEYGYWHKDSGVDWLIS